MDSKPGLKVGIWVSIAFSVFLGSLWYLSHYNPNVYTFNVTFSDTAGLVRQSVVRMRGVTVGEVKDVRLVNLQPIVTLAIQKSVRIPRGSKFQILTGILIANPSIEIRPADAPQSIAAGETVTGEMPMGALAALSPELSETVLRINKSFDKLSGQLDQTSGRMNKLLDQSSTLVGHVDQTVLATKSIVGDPRLRTAVTEMVTNFRDVSVNARETSISLRKTVLDIAQSGKGSIKNMTDKLTDILTRIDGTIDDANTVVKKLTEQVSDPRLQQSLQETAELARTTLARFDQIAADVHQLTGDPELQADLKETVAHLKNASSKGEQAVNRVNNLLGVVATTASSTRKLRLPHAEILGNISEQVNPGRLRLNAEARLGFGKTIANIGVYDFGQDTRLILQGGFHPSADTLFRYGLYASKLGAGFEWQPTPATGFRADLYDTSHTRLDLRGLFRVNNDVSAWLGGEDVFGRPTPVVGVQFAR